MKSCPECNSQKIIKDVKPLDSTDDGSSQSMWVSVDKKPDALIFKHRNYSTLKAHVCADCGLVQFYAEDPKMLWTAYQNRQKNV
ncbi:hypothetical protein BH20ACI1_BH20ACI1_28310 [soil metagenome]